MSKAILVLKHMPSRCNTCPCCDSDYERCSVTDKTIHDWKKKPSWCPLKEVPKRLGLAGRLPKYDTDTHYEQGYNACIDEILGGGE